MSNPDKRIIKKKNTTLIVLLIAALLAILLFVLWQQGIFSPKKPVVSEIQEIVPPSPVTPPAEEAPAAIAPPPPAPVAEAPAKPEKEDKCQEISREIRTFFKHLDQQEYMKGYRLKEDSHTHISRLVDKLIANPPVLVGETESLFAILNNTAHFYRVLKKDDVFLVKDILAHEGNDLERLMDLFYRWSLVAPECAGSGVKIHLPLTGLYEYAGFFLNTLGGQSYLFRRESRVRMLIKYYAILVLDRANDKSINKYGIDIRPSVDSLLGEIKTAQNLKEREEYLARLIELQDKYQQQYGKKQAVPKKN